MTGRHETAERVEAVESACRALVDADTEITYAAVADHSSISRSTLYRHPDLRAIVDEHRANQHDALTLTGLAVQIDQLRQSLEAVAANVRRHEETLRRLTRAISKR